MSLEGSAAFIFLLNDDKCARMVVVCRLGAHQISSYMRSAVKYSPRCFTRKNRMLNSDGVRGMEELPYFTVRVFAFTEKLPKVRFVSDLGSRRSAI